MAADHPFALCPKCLFGGALHAHIAPAETSHVAFSGLSVRRDFFDKYDILEKVAGGGQGEIWKTWDFEFRRCVAMKRISENAAASRPIVYRFLAEAQITSQLEHPGILPVFDMGLDPDGRPYYTTQLLSGTTLEDIWKRVHSPENSSEWTVNRALELLLRVCDVVGHAHSRGVIHRDLKPANILVGEFGDVRVIDWGSAHVLESALKNFEQAFVPLNSQVIETDRSQAIMDEPQSPLATANSGQPVTILFVPPEIIAGHLAELGPATDIYSMGVILYQLLTGEPPYFQPGCGLPERDELKKLILAGPPPSVRSIKTNASRDLAAICQKAMSHDKAGRYLSMQELASDIRAAMEIRPIRARRPTLWLKLQKWSQRNFSYILLGSAALVFVSVALSLAQAFKIQRDAARQTTYVRNAELAARSGRWREALEFWHEAADAGYHDSIYLSLQEAEAWTVLSEPEKSKAILENLSKRHDLGARRGAVLLRLGEHELFDHSTVSQGMRDIQSALSAGLDNADQFFARGLLADSTPESLEFFHQALQLDPYHYGVQLHSLGLEFLLGRHNELATHIRVFKILYPNDPTPVFIEAAEQAMQGNEIEAQKLLTSVGNQIGSNACAQLKIVLQTYTQAAKFYELGRWLSAEPTNGISVLSPENVFSAEKFPPGLRFPELPCLQKGLLEGSDALARLSLPFLGSPRNAVAQIEDAWRHHPEALVPVMGGLMLDSRKPAAQPAPPALLQLQSQLFQLGADSTSMFPNLHRLARFLAARADFDLSLASQTNAVAARKNCLLNVRQAIGEIKSPPEFQAYFGFAFKLDDVALAREIVEHWELQFPTDISARRSRIQVEMAAGAYGSALKLIDQLLANSPQNTWAMEQRGKILEGINKLQMTATQWEGPRP